ncbi:MAG TPA: chemotaxis protein CheW [Planctomycetota bacterium]|nr:chemotaxis protein CheW [Planctomycetota bacterium]
MSASAQYCSFRLGAAEYALDVADVQEVLRGLEWSPVPLAPASVIGLMNLRGQIVTVVDLAKLLGLEIEPGAPIPAPRDIHIVLSGPRPPLSFAVDEIGEVLAIETTSLLAPPSTLSPAVRACVRGLHLADQRLITILETRVLLEALMQPELA